MLLFHVTKQLRKAVPISNPPFKHTLFNPAGSLCTVASTVLWPRTGRFAASAVAVRAPTWSFGASSCTKATSIWINYGPCKFCCFRTRALMTRNMCDINIDVSRKDLFRQTACKSWVTPKFLLRERAWCNKRRTKRDKYKPSLFAMGGRMIWKLHPSCASTLKFGSAHANGI